MFIKIKTISVAESDLKKIVIERFLRNSHLFGCFFKRIFLGLSGLIIGSRIKFPPLYNFLNNIADSSLFGPSASFLAPADMWLIIVADVFFVLFHVADCSLGVHKSIDAEQAKISDFEVEIGAGIEIFKFGGDILAERINSTGDEDLTLGKIVRYLPICISKQIL